MAGLNGLAELLGDRFLLVALIIPRHLYRRDRNGLVRDSTVSVASSLEVVRDPQNLLSDRISDVSNYGLRDTIGRTYSSCRIGLRILTMI